MRRSNKIKSVKSKRGVKSRGRVKGEQWSYFGLHSLISMLFSLFVIIQWNLLNARRDTALFLFSGECWELVFTFFGLFVLIGLISRVIAYVLLKLIYTYGLKEEIKSPSELNVGINKWTSMTYFLATFLSAITFVLGALSIIQNNVFGRDTLFTLFISYLILKIGVYLLSWFTIEFFLSR